MSGEYKALAFNSFQNICIIICKLAEWKRCNAFINQRGEFRISSELISNRSHIKPQCISCLCSMWHKPICLWKYIVCDIRLDLREVPYSVNYNSVGLHNKNGFTKYINEHISGCWGAHVVVSLARVAAAISACHLVHL